MRSSTLYSFFSQIKGTSSNYQKKKKNTWTTLVCAPFYCPFISSMYGIVIYGKHIAYSLWMENLLYPHNHHESIWDNHSILSQIMSPFLFENFVDECCFCQIHSFSFKSMKIKNKFINYNDYSRRCCRSTSVPLHLISMGPCRHPDTQNKNTFSMIYGFRLDIFRGPIRHSRPAHT